MDNWLSDKLGSCLELRTERNYNQSTSLVLTVSNTKGVIPQAENFNHGRIIASQNTSGYRIVRKGDYAYNPARINVGSIARLKNYDSGIISPMYVCFTTNASLSGDYLEHFLQTKYFSDAVNRRLSGSVRECLNFSGLCDIDFTYPKGSNEQNLIAVVLTSADEAIAASRAIVEKYAAIKQGLMLDLLSGRVRLSGFTEEWEPLKIGNLLEFKNGLNKGKEFFGFGVPIINYMDVYTKPGIRATGLEGRVSLSKAEIKRFEVKKGDVFFTRTSETPEEVGYAAVLLDDIEDCVFSGFVLRGRPKTDKLDILYCQYCFGTPEIRREIMRGCTHTTRALTNGTFLSTIPISLPKPDEQHAIAETIMATDERLAAERERLKKLENIKRGLMDDLLTNRVSIDKLGRG